MDLDRELRLIENGFEAIFREVVLGTRAEAKRQTILDAAMKVFAERGYHYATVEDIAAEAGVAKGSVHAYFENKLDMLLTLLLLFWRTINKANAAKLAAEQDPVSALKSIFATFQSVLLKDAASIYWGKILQEGLPELHTLKNDGQRKKQQEIAREQRLLVRTIDAVIREGQEQGRISKAVKSGVLRQMLGGASQLLVYGLFMKLKKQAGIGYDEQDVRVGMEMLIDLLCAGPPAAETNRSRGS